MNKMTTPETIHEGKPIQTDIREDVPAERLSEHIRDYLRDCEQDNLDHGQQLELVVNLGLAGTETKNDTEKKSIRDILIKKANSDSYRVRRNALKYALEVMKTMEYFVSGQEIDLTKMTVRRRGQLGKFLENADNVEEYQTALDRFEQTTWESQKDIVLKQVLKSLKEDDVWEIRQASAEWLGNKADKLVELADNEYFTYKAIADSLELARRNAANREEYIEDEINSIKSAQHKLWDELYKQLYEKHLNIIKGTKIPSKEDQDNIRADVRATAIFKMGEESTLGSREAIRELVEQWVNWICNDEEPHLVEYTAETLRFNRFSVLALIEHLGKKSTSQVSMTESQEVRQLNRKWEAASKNSERIRKYEEQAQIWCEEKKHLFNELVLRELDRWLSQREEEDIQPSANLVEMVIESRKAIQLEKDKTLRVRRRIARQLADMSDPAYFEDQDSPEVWQRIRKELRKHAVPVVARLLLIEEDPEIRESIGRMLGYTGGQEAIDTLVHAVIGEEKKRTDRQDLLTEHYLEPAKARSTQAAEILQEAIDEAKRTVRILQTMNTATLIIGLSVLVVGIVIGLTNNNPGIQALGGLSAVGGFGWVIFQLINAPLDRIQNAMANLVQLETAFINYIWELNLNGTYIQSRYVSEGKLQSDEIKNTVERIEKSMQLTMNLVSRHTEEGTQQLVTRINKVEPAAGSSKEEIAIHGQHLVGDIKQKKDRIGMAAINHKLIPSECIADWDEYQVKIKLPDILQTNGGVIWISLFVDGMETNALPYHVQG